MLRKLEKYEVLDEIGHGGMGDVYKAEHRLMNRSVALKVINRDLVRKSGAVDRFHREVTTAAQLSHPNIVTAYDAEQAGDVHYLVMEFVEGLDLAEVVRQQGPLSAEQACNYIRQAAEGLQHAHEAGLVHRDIKPSNIMVHLPHTHRGAEDCVKVLDFGLARRVESEGQTMTGMRRSASLSAPPASMANSFARTVSSAGFRCAGLPSYQPP